MTQHEKICRYLLKHKKMTNMDCLMKAKGGYKAGTRIGELENFFLFTIGRRWVRVENSEGELVKVMEYYIDSDKTKQKLEMAVKFYEGIKIKKSLPKKKETKTNA